MKNTNKYLEDLRAKYLKKETESIETWHRRFKSQNKILLHNFGPSSWEINDAADMLNGESISPGYFRELVRYEMNENFNRIIGEKYKTIEAVLSKAKDSEEIIKYKAQLSLLKQLKQVEN